MKTGTNHVIPIFECILDLSYCHPFVNGLDAIYTIKLRICSNPAVLLFSYLSAVTLYYLQKPHIEHNRMLPQKGST